MPFFLFPFPFDISIERSPFSKCVQALFVHMVNGFNPNFSSIRVLFYSHHLIFHCAFVLCEPSVFFDVQKMKTSPGGDNQASDKH